MRFVQTGFTLIEGDQQSQWLQWLPCDQNQQVGDKVEEKLLEAKLFYLSLLSTRLMDKQILVHCCISKGGGAKNIFIYSAFHNTTINIGLRHNIQ